MFSQVIVCIRVLYDNVYTTVSIIPASDLGYGGYEELALDLVRFGANDAWCGFTMCQVEMRDSEEFLFKCQPEMGEFFGLSQHLRWKFTTE